MSLGLSPLAQAENASQIPSFVYTGAGCTGLAALPPYQALLGRGVDGAADFLDYTSSWANLVSETSWAAGCWKGKVGNLSLGVPMGVAQGGSSPLTDIGSGLDDVYYRAIAQTLVQNGFPNAYLRIGWEFNGDWYIWSAVGKTAAWISAYQHIVTVMRSVPGANFKYVWNPALYTQKVDPSLAYPGDAYVDVVATDPYDTSYDAGFAVPAGMWDSIENDAWGLRAVAAFAAAHNKPVAFPEWAAGTRPDGHGGGDDPLYIANMAAFMSSNNIAYQSYYNYAATDFNGLLSNGQYPSAMTAMMIDFGTRTAGAGATSATISNTGKIVTSYAAPYTPSTINLAATGCSEQAVQNAPGHYEVIVWSEMATSACSVKWSTPTRQGNVYNPVLGTTSTRSLGAASSVALTLAAKSPVIVALAQ